MSVVSRTSTKAVVSMKEIVDPYNSVSSTATATSVIYGNDPTNTTNDSITNASNLAIEKAVKYASTLLKSNKITNMTETQKQGKFSTSTSTTTGTTNTSSTSSSTVTSSSTAVPWNTDQTTLQYATSDTSGIEYNYYVLKGFSLTTQQYLGGVFVNEGFYDFGYYMYDPSSNAYYTHYQNGTSTESTGDNGNSGITLNTYYLMQNVYLQLVNSGSGTSESPYSAPMIRIPLCGDYWLNGSANYPTVNQYSTPYSLQGQTNVYFTAAEYQQSITDLIYYCYTTWETSGNSTPITFSIDLHYSYSSPSPQTSGSYPDSSGITYQDLSGNIINTPITWSSASSNQIVMPGVAVIDTSGGSSGLTLTDQTTTFWKSVASLYGINASGNPIGSPSAYTYTGGSPSSYFTKSSSTTVLPVSLLQNIMFELFNEPFTDRLVYSNGGTSYSNNYCYYVNGGSSSYEGIDYNFTGFGQMYNTVRQTIGAQNICIVAASDNFAWMEFNTSSNNGQWDTSSNSINTNTYNCFTQLQQAIEGGDIYLSSSDPSGGNFDQYSFYNCLLNLHPYSGPYAGGCNHPGYYDSTYYSSDPSGNYTSNNPKVGFGQIVSALIETSGSQFYMPFPMICTEYGQYDLPWSNYTDSSSNQPQTNYQYSIDYFTYGNTVQYIGLTNYTTPYYNGNYVDASGITSTCPANIGYLRDFNNSNVSHCAFAIRPNSGGDGEITYVSNNYAPNSWLLGDINPEYYSWGQNNVAWSGVSPDVICGSANAYVNFQDYETSYNPPENTPIIMPDTSFCLQVIGYNNNQNLSTTTINYGANGADFQYIIDNYYNT